jgi:hypothetical protein
MSRRWIWKAYVAAAGAVAAASGAAAAESWFVPFGRTQVAPVRRSNTTQLVEAGTIDTDGFKELVFSLGGEFKEGVPSSGRVGAVLVPDHETVIYLLQNEGQFVFPLEATFEVKPGQNAIFVSPQQTARIAFPRYRVYLYNETTSGAEVALFAYRTR